MNPNIYVPELDYFFHEYWKTRGEFSIHEIPIPVILSDISIIKPGSFIELLFSENFSEDTYRYLFLKRLISSFSRPIRERLLVTKALQPYMCETTVSDSSGTINIFSLENDDILLLNHLLGYRVGETVDLSSTDYNSLSTNLSKMIYLYLDLVVNGNYTDINSETPMSDSTSVLEVLYEIYLVNETYKRIKTWEITIDNEILILRPVQDKFIIDSTTLTNIYVTLSEVPYSSSDFYLFRNAVLQSFDLYTIVDSTSVTTIEIEEAMEIVEDDVVIVEYQVEET